MVVGFVFCQTGGLVHGGLVHGGLVHGGLVHHEGV